MKNPKARQSLLARIHIAKKKLGMSDEFYRDTLEANYKVRSAADLFIGQLGELARSLERILREDNRKRRTQNPEPRTPNPEHSGYPGRPKNMDGQTEKTGQLKKIEALLSEKGNQQGRPVPWNYAHSMAQRMHKVEKIEWCTAHQLRGVIAALIKDAQRHGRKIK